MQTLKGAIAFGWFALSALAGLATHSVGVGLGLAGLGIAAAIFLGWVCKF